MFPPGKVSVYQRYKPAEPKAVTVVFLPPQMGRTGFTVGAMGLGLTWTVTGVLRLAGQPEAMVAA